MLKKKNGNINNTLQDIEFLITSLKHLFLQTPDADVDQTDTNFCQI